MFTAEMAKRKSTDDLDDKIKRAVEDASGNNATIRIYMEDWYFGCIGAELVKRGFKNIRVPDVILKGDVYFEWDL